MATSQEHSIAESTHADMSGDRRPALLGISIFCAAFSTICVAARMFRCARLRRFRYDDAFMLLAPCILIPYAVLYCLSTRYGNGLHIGLLDFEDLLVIARYTQIGATLAAACIMCAKLAVGGTLLHVDISKTYKGLIITTMIITFLGNLAQIVVFSDQCQFNAMGEIVGNNCFSLTTAKDVSIGTSVINLVTDLFLVMTPIYFIRKVRLEKREKTAIQITLCCMFIATALSLSRVCILPKSVGDQDFTYSGIIIEVLTIVEASMYCVSAALPAIRQLIGGRVPSGSSTLKTHSLSQSNRNTKRSSTMIMDSIRSRDSLAKDGNRLSKMTIMVNEGRMQSIDERSSVV